MSERHADYYTAMTFIVLFACITVSWIAWNVARTNMANEAEVQETERQRQQTIGICIDAGFNPIECKANGSVKL